MVYGLHDSLWLYFKDEATNFNKSIANAYDFRCSMYRAKLLGNTVADGVNGILRNTAITVSVKYLSNFWRSLKILLINCKVELKLKWAKHYLLA